MIHLTEKTLQNFERAFGVIGLGIFAWMIYRLGPERVAANLHQVRWGFFLMVVMKGVGYVGETLAWRLLLSESGKRIGFWRLFKTCVEGNALNYITVTHMGGEPFKALAVRDHTSLAESAASVIVLKFCVLMGFWLVVACGFGAVFLGAEVSPEIRLYLFWGLAGLTAALLLLYWIQKTGLFRPLAWLLSRLKTQREWVRRQVERLTRLDTHILKTYRSRRGRLPLAVGLTAIEWIEEILFIWLALAFLGITEGWFLPTIIGATSLLLNHFFFFVPWRAGTQEGTMVLTFTLLDLSEPAGLSVAIMRRMRELVWVFAGLILFALETIPSGPASMTRPLES